MIVENCDRCKKSLQGQPFRMSRFNTDLLCMDCVDKETRHPDYQIAVEAELAEVRKGNYNYPGIGYPGENGRLGDV